MNDFLKNLRNSRKKEPSGPKKNLDGHYYAQTDRRPTQGKKTASSEPLLSLLSGLTDLLPEFSENTSRLAQSLEKFLESNDLLVEARIRQYNAVSTFFDHLNSLFPLDSPSAAENGIKIKAGDPSGTRYTKDEILLLIRTMRKNEATFGAIADYLKEKRIPTFSGRGEWHAQTVHRLCK
ncbi:MAG: hypothetical protein A2464_06405 [Deltaproteobacteria bacterium RIFOXYC2_FULL_48_10]|nr:MAG: hypothetical protein A2464_06405 [Deltaproteobacteria bacterium RIFOXYC2_FULL_48_10]OGR45835.1 MAG: hypothetical protein A3J80_13715 [Desulfobacula sp. RIFOXYB2_FULL_45_6]